MVGLARSNGPCGISQSGPGPYIGPSIAQNSLKQLALLFVGCTKESGCFNACVPGMSIGRFRDITIVVCGGPTPGVGPTS